MEYLGLFSFELAKQIVHHADIKHHTNFYLKMIHLVEILYVSKTGQEKLFYLIG